MQWLGAQVQWRLRIPIPTHEHTASSLKGETSWWPFPNSPFKGYVRFSKQIKVHDILLGHR